MMDPWQVFCELCARVAEEQNVYLDVLITGSGIEMLLYPLEGDKWEEDDE